MTQRLRETLANATRTTDIVVKLIGGRVDHPSLHSCTRPFVSHSLFSLSPRIFLRCIRGQKTCIEFHFRRDIRRAWYAAERGGWTAVRTKHHKTFIASSGFAGFPPFSPLPNPVYSPRSPLTTVIYDFAPSPRRYRTKILTSCVRPCLLHFFSPRPRSLAYRSRSSRLSARARFKPFRSSQRAERSATSSSRCCARRS